MQTAGMETTIPAEFAVLRKMQEIDQDQPGQSVVRDDGNQIIDRCNQRTGRNGGIHADFLEKDRDDRSG